MKNRVYDLQLTNADKVPADMKPKSDTPRDIAERIADKLFANHFSEKADRLVLMYEQSPYSRFQRSAA